MSTKHIAFLPYAHESYVQAKNAKHRRYITRNDIITKITAAVINGKTRCKVHMVPQDFGLELMRYGYYITGPTVDRKFIISWEHAHDDDEK